MKAECKTHSTFSFALSCRIRSVLLAFIDWHPPRPQISNVLSLHATQAIIDYVIWLDPKSSDKIVKALKDLQDRILLLDKLHERFLCTNEKC